MAACEPRPGYSGIDAAVAGAPYIWVRKTGRGCVTRGVQRARLGRALHFPGRERPDGVFAEWSWDGTRLSVRHDRYGFHPLYYVARDGEIGVSPSLPKLLLEGAPTELDDPALAVFLRLGYFLAEETPFRAIRALPPGATLEWEGGELRLAGGFTLATPRRLGRDEAIDGYISLFREAVRRRIPADDDVVVPLSGGRDSRHILLELCEAGRPPSLCLTARHYPPRTDEDAELATQVATALAVRHVVLDQPERRLRSELLKNLKTGFCADEGTAFMAIGDYLAGEEWAVFDGIGGDVLSAGLFLNEGRLALFEAGRFSALAESFLWAEERVTGLLSDEYRRRWSHELAVEHLALELRRHADAPNPVGSFIFWNRTRREIALFPYGFYGPGLTPICPFLDHEVYDFLASLPASLLLDRQFHTRTILRAHPRYAHVPFESRAPFYRYDDRYRRHFRSLIRELEDYLEREPSAVVSAPRVSRLLSDYHRAGKEPLQFGEHLAYLLQLERFAAEAAVGRSEQTGPPCAPLLA